MIMGMVVYMKIRTKLLLQITFSVLIVLGCGYLISASISKNALEEQVTERIMAMERERTTQITDYADSIYQSVSEYASFICTVHDFVTIEQYNTMIKEIVDSKYFIIGGGVWFEPYVCDSNSQQAYTYVTYVKDEFVVRDITSDQYDYFSEDFYTKIKKNQVGYLKEIHTVDWIDTPIMTYVEPIITKDGKFLGVITLDFDVKKMGLFMNSSYTDEFDSFILDSNGDFISKSNIYMNISADNIYDVQNDFMQEQILQIYATENGTGYFSHLNEDYILAFDTVPELNWKCVYTIPKSLITNPIKNITLAYVIISILMVFILIIWLRDLIEKLITHPLKILLDEFKNITENVYCVNISQELLQSKDEFGDIGVSLENMKFSLKNYQDSLKRQTQKLEEEKNNLRTTMTYIQAVIGALPQMVFVFNKAGICVDCRGTKRVLFYEAEEYLGKHINEVTNVEAGQRLLKAMHSLNEVGQMQEVDVTLDINGSLEYLKMNLSYMTEDEIVIVPIRVTAFKAQLSQIEYLSTHDQLTGLGNRMHLTEVFEEYIKEQVFPISVITCNINGLKAINDTIGRSKGDKQILRLAGILKNSRINKESIFRVGGDEFTIIVQDTDNDQVAILVDELVVDCVNDTTDSIELSVSFGYATMMDDKDSMNETIREAENYMYKQKLYSSVYKKGSTVEIINSTLLAKNLREQRHSERVSYLCEKTAKCLGMNKYTQNKLKVAGLLHDIGKIGIPERVLDKPGQLTDEEFAEIRMHPAIGYKILNSAGHMTEISEIIYAHHEKWDGTGYPRRLKGEEIPIEARIIAISDSYDAMTSDRSYRDGLPKENAIKELMKCRGTQFEAELVDFFIEQVLDD